ncbi:hypothetical protein A3860_12215 [Niastella vici]|uniref:Uncharacterized protein n=1 Tax=Niastella vici TaxID=1703345 RepID=A0A1V9G6S6_9BACT|nr:hypothetical protein A3860_12215 [Niastella vici]
MLTWILYRFKKLLQVSKFSYRLPVTGFRLLVAGYKLLVTGCQLLVSGYWLPVTGPLMRNACQ